MEGVKNCSIFLWKISLFYIWHYFLLPPFQYLSSTQKDIFLLLAVPFWLIYCFFSNSPFLRRKSKNVLLLLLIYCRGPFQPAHHSPINLTKFERWGKAGTLTRLIKSFCLHLVNKISPFALGTPRTYQNCGKEILA